MILGASFCGIVTPLLNLALPHCCESEAETWLPDQEPTSPTFLAARCRHVMQSWPMNCCMTSRSSFLPDYKRGRGRKEGGRERGKRERKKLAFLMSTKLTESIYVMLFASSYFKIFTIFHIKIVNLHFVYIVIKSYILFLPTCYRWKN